VDYNLQAQEANWGSTNNLTSGVSWFMSSSHYNFVCW